MTLPKNITVRELIRAMEQDGFYFERARGSHYIYRHPDGRRAAMPFHGKGHAIPRGTLKNIIEREAMWNDDDLRRLGLLK
jgi:predicted RNA binding protein YcfA (HicA-like mRNA interferase family)